MAINGSSRRGRLSLRQVFAVPLTIAVLSIDLGPGRRRPLGRAVVADSGHPGRRHPVLLAAAGIRFFQRQLRNRMVRAS
jgi:hypothetical protein